MASWPDGLLNKTTPRWPRKPKPLRFIDAEKGVADVKAALEGAKYILMERFAEEDAGLLDKLRNYLGSRGKPPSVPA